DDSPSISEGVFIFKMRWGKCVSGQGYVDTRLIEDMSQMLRTFSRDFVATTFLNRALQEMQPEIAPHFSIRPANQVVQPSGRSVARVAALYDIHGNLPALEAVLEEIREAEVDQIVVGGDVVPGPMPGETLARLLALDRPVHFIQGNGELAMLAQMAA